MPVRINANLIGVGSAFTGSTDKTLLNGEPMTNVNLRTGTAAKQIPAEDALQIDVSLPRLLNQRDLAKYIGKSTAWCERARWAGDGPKFVKLGRNVRYRADDVLQWIEENAHTSTSDGGAA